MYTPKVNDRVLQTFLPAMKLLHNLKLNISSSVCGFFFAGEKELVEFLTEEILAEKKAQKVKTIPTELDGFKVTLDGAEVELTKQAAGEKYVMMVMKSSNQVLSKTLRIN